MRWNAATRTRLLIDMTLDIDPTDSTVEVQVGEVWYPATWLEEPVTRGQTWAQTARTDAYFAGPDATATGATVLAAGSHATATRIVKGGDELVADAERIVVE
jgi:hypothetical protein